MILCCGEALIDMIPAQTQAGGTGYVPHSGGAIFNTAIALGRLGVPTGFLTGLSTDMFGTQLADDLAKSNVNAGLSPRLNLPTTLAFVQLNAGQATYTFYDENTAGRSLSADTEIHLPDDILALYFGGISLISEPAADFFAALAETESASRTIVLDPNIRPGFVRDEPRYRARLNRMIAVADIVKVSDEDLDWLVAGDAPMKDKAAELLQAGPSLLVVTRGDAGAIGFMRNGAFVDVPAVKANVVDTVGAGDTFNAGFLADLYRHGLLWKASSDLRDTSHVTTALQFAASVAAVTVSRSGANPPWADELEVPGTA